MKTITNYDGYDSPGGDKHKEGAIGDVMISYLREHKWRILLAVGVALYLKFLLIPTGVVFYELHHLTGVDGIYWGYSLFKAAGYYFGAWPYQTPTCIGIAVLIAVPWRRVYRTLKQRTLKSGATA